MTAIASHRRLYGRKGQYSTVTEHMPEDLQAYLEWNGDRFRKWTKRIGESTFGGKTHLAPIFGIEIYKQRYERQNIVFGVSLNWRWHVKTVYTKRQL